MRQPWASAIIWGGKSPENRTRNIAGGYRGPLAIHAGLVEDEAAYSDEMVRQMLGEYDDGWLSAERFGTTGAIIGVVDLVSVHHDSDHGPDRCSWWAQRGDWHLMVANPRPLPEPIPTRGQLGLWTPPAEVLEQLQAVTA